VQGSPGFNPVREKRVLSSKEKKIFIGIALSIVALIVLFVQLRGISESDLVGRWDIVETTHSGLVADWIEFSRDGTGQMGAWGMRESFRWELERGGVLIISQLGVSLEYDVALSGRRLTITLDRGPGVGAIRTTYIR